MRHPEVIAFCREVLAEWQRDNVLSQGAALAYYALFSLAPLLALVIIVAGLGLGQAAAEGQIVGQIAQFVGPDSARTVQDMLQRASTPAAGIGPTILSLVTMLLGASGVFGQLRSSLNHIWGVTEIKRAGVWGAVWQRLVALLLIVGIGVLMVASVALAAVVDRLHDQLATTLPLVALLVPPLNFGGSLLVATAFFAAVYTLVPDADLHWRDAWVGATITALLFTLGKSLIGLYLGRVAATSIYGAAGSLVLLLLWVYYSAQLLLFGAEITEVYTRRYGSRRLLT